MISTSSTFVWFEKVGSASKRLDMYFINIFDTTENIRLLKKEP